MAYEVSDDAIAEQAKGVATPSNPARDLPRGRREDFNAKADAPVKTGMREQVSNEEQHQQIEQVLPREESTPGKANPCAAWGDLRGEA